MFIFLSLFSVDGFYCAILLDIVLICCCTPDNDVDSPSPDMGRHTRIISRYFIGYAERSKGYRFYCPSHSTRFVESRNAKFPENDLISGSDQSLDLISENDHSEAPSTSSEQLVIMHNNPQVQMDVEQS